MKMVIQPFVNNVSFDQLSCPTIGSVGQFIQYINSQYSFYNGPYTYFMDFDRTYLRSNDGMYIDAKDGLYPYIAFDIRDLTEYQVHTTGMVFDKDQKAYIVYSDGNSAKIITDRGTSQLSSNVIAVTSEGQTTSATIDTLENGGNYYRIDYKLEYLSDDRLIPLVVNEFNFVSGNIGTNYSPVLSTTGYNLAKILDDTAVLLKQYFRGLFYNNKVQTFTFVYLYEVCVNGLNSSYFYDPYLIEFIIKNKILANTGDKYEYIDHKTFPKADFPIKYSKSIWRAIETKDKDHINSCIVSSPGIYIDDPATIFSTRYENYFEMTYENPDPVADRWSSRLSIIPSQVIGHINEGQLFFNSPLSKYNLLIKYFNDMEINAHDMDPLQRIDSYSNDKDTYYLIPIIIFILEYNIKKIMARANAPETS